MMSSFLAEPLTAKTTSNGKGNNLKYGESGMQGWRSGMEDAHVSIPVIAKQPGLSFFGIFDGHGGNLISTNAAQIVLDSIMAAPDFSKEKTAENLSSALLAGFLATDERLRRLPEIESLTDDSGSTSVTVLVTPTHIVVANAGDSRIVMSKNYKAVPLSFDHKPTNPTERTRIEAAGGTVLRGRVCGGVAVSRGFGDFMYKKVAGLPPSEQAISPAPEITVQERHAEDDEFLLLACDGVWDVMTNEEVVQFVWQRLHGGEKVLGRVCESLLDECLRRNSRDNISAQLVLFEGGIARMPKQSRICVVM